MPTVLSLYANALTEAGQLQPQMTPSGTQTAFAQQYLANMVRTWSQKRERLFFIPEASYPLKAGQGSYQIGPGAADWNTTATNSPYTRPVQIQTGQVVVGTARRWPLNILTRPTWSANQSRTITDPDGPLDLFYDDNRPLATINVAPIPLNNQTMYLGQWNPLHVFQIGDEQLLVESYYPEGYIEPLITGLGIALCRAYRQQISPDLLGRFNGSIQIIENTNKQNMLGEFGFSRTLQTPTRGEMGMMPPPQPPQDQGQ